MRLIFVLSFLANVELTVVSLVVGPAEVAMHFGPGGEPDSWGPSIINALVMTGVELLVLLPFLFTPQLLRVVPPKFINLPNKDYWLSDENRERASAILSGQLYMFGSVTFLFLFLVGLLALHANLSSPVRLREDLFWWAFGLYMAFMIIWTIAMVRAFRVPEKARR